MTAPWRALTIAIAGTMSAVTAIPIAAAVPVASVAGKIAIGMTAGLGAIGCAAILGAGLWFITQWNPIDWGPRRCRSCELVTLEVPTPSK